MPGKVTRRELAVLFAAAAAVSASAQTAGPASRSPEQELEAARDQSKRMASQLASVELPMETEPDFVFKP